ncbi:hypothetical protein [Lysinibacillus sp. FSL M8-0355]|uniref:hypothetical protein n=1 Tax=Lysinibacillus sp. FSL M8-0355 TaxID=2921719 RepID=UPI0030FAD262
MVKSLRDINEIVLENMNVIVIDVEKDDSDKMIRNKVITALVNAYAFYTVGEADEVEFSYFKNQLSYYIKLFFNENNSFEDIVQRKEIKIQGISNKIVFTDKRTSSFDISARVIEINEDYCDFSLPSAKRLFASKIGSMLLSMTQHYSRVGDVIKNSGNKYGIAMYNLMSTIVNNNIDKLMFGEQRDKYISILDVGNSKYKLSFENELESESEKDDGDKVYGRCITYNENKYSPDNKILLKKDMSTDFTFQVFIHELFHAVINENEIDFAEIYRRYEKTGTNYDEMNTVIEEEVVSKMSATLSSVFLRNKETFDLFFPIIYI